MPPDSKAIKGHRPHDSWRAYGPAPPQALGGIPTSVRLMKAAMDTHMYYI